jgi:hypothetical protein
MMYYNLSHHRKSSSCQDSELLECSANPESLPTINGMTVLLNLGETHGVAEEK